MRDALTTWGQLFTGRKSPENSVPRAEPGLGADGLPNSGKPAPVLFEHQLGMCTEHGRLGNCPQDCKAILVTESSLSEDFLDKFLEELNGESGTH